MSHLDDFLANYGDAHRNVPPNVRLSLLFEDLAKATKADIALTDLQPSDQEADTPVISSAQSKTPTPQPDSVLPANSQPKDIILVDNSNYYSEQYLEQLLASSNQQLIDKLLESKQDLIELDVAMKAVTDGTTNMADISVEAVPVEALQQYKGEL